MKFAREHAFIAMIAVFVTAGFAYWAVCQIKVGGPLYSQIVQSKDVVADILPPPEYALEAYLEVLQLTDETEPAVRDWLVSDLKRLAKDYRDRHAYWDQNLPAGTTRDALLKDSYEPATAFFATIETEFLPAVRARALTRS